MFTPPILLKLNMISGEQHTDVERESARTKHKFRVDCGREGGIGKLGILLTHTHFPGALRSLGHLPSFEFPVSANAAVYPSALFHCLYRTDDSL